tara:strand:+ start:526 stop:1611 length:1086 start_codon:yes stop_codon:yes gene_type:complete
MVKKKPTTENISPSLKKATEMKLAGVGTFLSTLPLIGKPVKSFAEGAKKGIAAMDKVEADEKRKYYVSVFRDPQFQKELGEKGISKKTPLELAGAYTARTLGDLTTDESRKFYWRFNHPLAIADEALKGTVDPTKALNKYEVGLLGLAALQPAVAVTGAYDPTNLGQLGRPKGFKQNNPTQEDKTQTANPSAELFQRFVQGRTGRPLAFADAQKEIPNLTKGRYANYLNFLYNNPDPIGKATGGFVKFTRENLEGNPEAKFLGYPVSIPAVTSAVGGIAGTRLALKTSPQVKEVTTEVSTEGTKTTLVGPKLGEKGYKRFLGRGLAGGVAGAVPGILAGKLINQALAKSELDKQPPMHPYK